MFEHVVVGGFGVALNLLSISFYCLFVLLFDVLELLLSGPRVIQQAASNDFNGVAVLSDILDFIAATVGDAGVRHGVAVVPISVELKEDRPVLQSVLLGELGGLSHSQDIVAIGSKARHLVATGEEPGVHGGALN